MPYEANGRTQQKRRTKHALIAAARDLVAQGITPTVDDAAAAAAISRTTAYRYFPTRAALLAAAHPETAVVSLLPKRAPQDVTTRLRHVVHAYSRTLLATEVQQRTMLRLSLDPAHSTELAELPLRQGRAIAWLEDALSPLRARIGAARVHRLALAIRSATGIEAFVWLVDVARQSRAQAIKLMQGSADALLAAALVRKRRRS